MSTEQHDMAADWFLFLKKKNQFKPQKNWCVAKAKRFVTLSSSLCCWSPLRKCWKISEIGLLGATALWKNILLPLSNGLHLMLLADVDVCNVTQTKQGPVFQCIISSSRPPEELRQIKIPFPLFPLVVLRAEDCAVAWVPMKKPLSVWAVKALSAQRGWSLPSVFITPVSLIDSLFALSCLSAGSHCPPSPQKIIWTWPVQYKLLPQRTYTHRCTNVYMYSESTHRLSFSLRELDSPCMDPWIPHNTSCWLINNSILSVSKRVWVQPHLHPRHLS